MHPNGSQSAPQLSLEQARALALKAGFTEAGLAPLPHSNAARDAERFEQWIRAGNAGTMRYLERAEETDATAQGSGNEKKLLRARVATPFPWARSAIVCFAGYHSAQPRSTDPASPDAGWIARYAWSGRRVAADKKAADQADKIVPSDYHKVLVKRLRVLESSLRASIAAEAGEEARFEARGFVDTGPVVERSLAVAAGLGWSGKNTCLIHPKLGSFGFLAVLLTSLDVAGPQKQLKIAGGCGSCRRCIDACPTGALDTPYQMDATRCIAYLTIEHRAPIQPELAAKMGRQVFGCDICQDVCPWNRKAPVSADSELVPRPELVNPSLEWLASLTETDWERLFNGSPVRRAGFSGFRRNVGIAIGNSRKKS